LIPEHLRGMDWCDLIHPQFFLTLVRQSHGNGEHIPSKRCWSQVWLWVKPSMFADDQVFLWSLLVCIPVRKSSFWMLESPLTPRLYLMRSPWFNRLTAFCLARFNLLLKSYPLLCWNSQSSASFAA
jgi:hypothetical protein